MIDPVEAVEVIAALAVIPLVGVAGTAAGRDWLLAARRVRPLTAPAGEEVRVLAAEERPPVPAPRHRLADAVTGSFSAAAVLARLKAEEKAAPPLPRVGRRRLDADAP